MPKTYCSVLARVGPELLRPFDAVAASEGRSRNEAMTEAMKEWLDRHNSGQARELSDALRGRVPA